MHRSGQTFSPGGNGRYLASSASTAHGVLTASGPYTGIAAVKRAPPSSRSSRRGAGPAKRPLPTARLAHQPAAHWGPPIPIIYCPEHGAVAVPDEQLPVLLPVLEDYRRRGPGVAAASNPEFVQHDLPRLRQPARRETDVSDNFLYSAWYFLRYPSSDDEHAALGSGADAQVAAGGQLHRRGGAQRRHCCTRASSRWRCTTWASCRSRSRSSTSARMADHMKDGEDQQEPRNVVNPDDYLETYRGRCAAAPLMFMGPYEGAAISATAASAASCASWIASGAWTGRIDHIGRRNHRGERERWRRGRQRGRRLSGMPLHHSLHLCLSGLCLVSLCPLLSSVYLRGFILWLCS